MLQARVLVLFGRASGRDQARQAFRRTPHYVETEIEDAPWTTNDGICFYLEEAETRNVGRAGQGYRTEVSVLELPCWGTSSSLMPALSLDERSSRQGSDCPRRPVTSIHRCWCLKRTYAATHRSDLA